MKNKLLPIFLLLVLSGPCKLFAQENQFSGWAALFHSQKLSSHWGLHFDGQIRSANHFDYLRNVLIRPGVNYHIDKNKTATLGYAYVATNGRAGSTHTYRPESRIWEQFIVTQKIGVNTALAHRFRLEQRFLGNTTNKTDHYFSQRFRYFARAVVPIKRDSVFSKGPFIGLQNEVFVNVQNKAKVNKHFFDQNRAYVSFGYRLHKKLDLELGYLNQYTKQAAAYTINHVVQTAVYTRF